MAIKMKENHVSRLKRIIEMANKLNWCSSQNKGSYPIMQLSEVEKCMLAMVDDFEFIRMEQWVEELGNS